MAEQAAQPERERSWDGILRREIDVELRSINEDERSFEVVASTEALDSHGDVLRQFWDLSRYEKNGVVLWNHNITSYFGGEAEDTLPIGRGEARVEGKKLVAKLYLLKGEADKEPLVDKIWRRVQQKVLKAVSVGFRPGQVTRKVNAAGETEFYELGSKERPNELREISLVPMGSNAEAVAKSIAWERKHLAEDSIAASAAESDDTSMAMTTDEQKALSDALAAKTAAETRFADSQVLVKKYEADLAAEKAISSKLGEDLALVRAELKAAKGESSKAILDSLQSVKFAPAEREELEKMVELAGIDRVKALLEKRADITLTQPATAGGKPLGNENKGTAPAPVDTSASPDAASDDLLKAVNDDARKS
jgi:hypothetical protein